MKTVIGALGLLAGVAALVSTNSAKAQAVPDQFAIQRIDYFGAACPSGSATVDISSDRRSFVVTYTRLQAQAGPGVSLTQATKACTLTLYLVYPSGWAWSIAAVATRGNVSLGPSVFADVRLRYSFPGGTSAEQILSVAGPRLGDFELRKAVAERIWSPCGGRVLPMTIGSNVRVNNGLAPSQPGLITVEQSDGTFKVIYDIEWQHC